MRIKSVNLHKSYQNNNAPVYAVFGCNLEIKEGEFVAITGTKDAGKTTLLHLLSGFEKPSGGDIYIDDDKINTLKEDELAVLRRDKIGYILGNDSLIPELKVHENILIPLILAGKKYDADYYEELKNKLHLKEILNRYPKQLTEVQLRYVSLARALINKPDILILDEPEGEENSYPDKEMLDYLLDAVYRCHKTLIVATNHPEIYPYANHVIKMRCGVVIEDRMQ